MTPCLRYLAGVSFKCPFVILHKRHGNDMEPVDKCLKGKLLADEAFFEDYFPLDLLYVVNGTGKVYLFSHDSDTFSPGETYRFDGQIAVMVFYKRDCLGSVVEDPVGRVAANMMVCH